MEESKETQENNQLPKEEEQKRNPVVPVAGFEVEAHVVFSLVDVVTSCLPGT